MSTRQRLLLPFLALTFLVVAATPAFAHPGHGGHDLAAGWEHPFSGLDHLAAMVAVGLLAVRVGGRAIWVMPCTFLGSMLAGGLLAWLGMPLPGVEWGISASVLVLGLLVAATSIIPLRYAAGLVAFGAVFHGHAHAHEMVAGGSLAAYAVGFLLATAVLHAAGIAVGMALARWLDPRAVRLTGGLISTMGLLLLCGLI